ncbi:hypothetical protein JIN77_13600 [Verrucomicrobiaceae bacterium R5-34]|uniref:Uncharacterized protein n=1 Tax=Oceaniferula flava TaxID=2800421 RepID=A0AAE2SGD0_9BACT|nr:hypothetical protein [Oceaniferula flavus]MBK1831765.1 hypothetical protein [Verrucomicrobiaceae bacterium R5-34]MBK1856090.1 hypothetical protein [Oceaniferula flavus]MBM1137397.1 hypothetical protein [Oceaniferula flavus]
MKPGGSEGGSGSFLMGGGLVLMALGMYLFLDSVRVQSGHFGWVSGMIGRGRQGMETTSMGIVFLPFLIGVGVLFFDAAKKWAWWLAGLGLAVIAIEILSRIRFVLDMKTTHLLMILCMVAAGAGMALRAFATGSSDK